jgi:hypothetical protein
MLSRQITLHVNQGFAVPEVYTGGTMEEVEEALWLGANIQNSVRTRRSNDEARKISELKDTEIARIQTTYNEKLTKLLDDIRTVSTEKDKLGAAHAEGLKEARGLEREAVGREWEEKMRVLRRDHEVLATRYEALEERRKVLEESREADIRDAVARTEGLMEKLVVAKQEQLTKMETTWGKLNEAMVKQAEEVARLSGTISKRGANVKTKGSDYEEEFHEKLARAYGLCKGFKLKDTRLGMGHEMDFSLEMEGQTVMWELKNYSSAVPKAEVDKFLRDLKENAQARVGVMISRVTDIYGKAGSGLMLTEFEGDKMMIYISRFEEFCGEDEGRVFQMLMSLFRVWWEYHKDGSSVGLDRVEIVRELEKAVEDIAKRRTDWRRHKAHLDELGRWAMDLLDESEGRLDRMLKKARCENDVDVHGGAGGPLVIPEGVFRDSGEEREVSWIRSIMRVCVPGGEIEVRELVELLTVHHKLSKDTIRSNIMSVMRDSAVIKKGVVKYIKGVSKFIPECLIKI